MYGAYTFQLACSHNFQHGESDSIDQFRMAARLARLPRRHFPGAGREGDRHQRHGGPCASSGLDGAGTFVGGIAPRVEGQFHALGETGTGQSEFRMANRLRRFQRKRVKCRGGHTIHRNSRRASQEVFLPGIIHRLSEKEQCPLRRKISLGLIFFRPSGAASTTTYPRLTPWAAFFRRSARLPSPPNHTLRFLCTSCGNKVLYFSAK